MQSELIALCCLCVLLSSALQSQRLESQQAGLFTNTHWAEGNVSLDHLHSYCSRNDTDADVYESFTNNVITGRQTSEFELFQQTEVIFTEPSDKEETEVHWCQCGTSERSWWKMSQHPPAGGSTCCAHHHSPICPCKHICGERRGRSQTPNMICC